MRHSFAPPPDSPTGTSRRQRAARTVLAVALALSLVGLGIGALLGVAHAAVGVPHPALLGAL